MRNSYPYITILAVIFAACLAMLGSASTAQAQENDGTSAEPECEGLHFPVTDSGTAEDGAQPERLIAPPLPENPTQLDCGAYQYAMVCGACHGDLGQGLTEEWRAAWGRDEMDCWQSGCHAKDHPPEGFEFPKFAPRIIGDGALQRFDTAADLHNFISANMPWHAPGSLDDKTYWQLVTFLAESNGVEVAEYLTAENAGTVRLHPLPEPQPVASITENAPDENPPFPYEVFYVALGTVLVGGLGLGIAIARRA